jgi:hypothetical protein
LNQQQQKTGTEAEQSFAKSMAKNSSMQKLCLMVNDVSSRHIIDRAASKNKEIARKARYALTSASRAKLV